MSVALGFLLSIGFILLSVVSGGDRITALFSMESAMIVLGGTFGAVMTQFGPGTMLQAVKGCMALIKPAPSNIAHFINQVADWSNLARSQGSLSLESVLGSTNDPFQRKGLQMIIDNTSQEDLRAIFNILSDNAYRNDMVGAEFWEAAGGYTPTIGVLGAVLGLIHVMTRLDHPAELGPGIATAFTATIYGVGAANLFFLPAAGKLRIRIHEEQQRRHMMLEGVISILEGINPRMLEVKLSGFLEDNEREAREKAA